MTTDEKLQHFTSVIMENTQAECEKSFEEYKRKMDQYFEEHKAESVKNKELERGIEEDRIRRKASKDFTMNQLHIRRKINHKQVELKGKLLKEVKELLDDFYKTDDYKKLLIKKIEEAKKVARGEDIDIYIDAKDESLLSELEKATGEQLIMDGQSFGGGIIAKIPKKNILIDNSFEAKLDNWMEKAIIQAD